VPFIRTSVVENEKLRSKILVVRGQFLSEFNMLVDERRDKLLEVLRQKGFASIPELAAQLGVSSSTLRRDIEQLEESGAARRAHGGAFYTGGMPKLPPFEERQPEQWEKKRAIARRAAELIDEGDAILLDGGSTTYEVARQLVGRRLQVVTNSLPVATLLASDPSTHLVLLGGYVYPRTGVALGPLANRMLESICVRRTILSVGGITERGFFNSNDLLVETERAMMRIANEVVVVADSTKFGRQSLAHLAELASVHRMVVDDAAPCNWQDTIRKAGVELIVAEGGEG
jgi:DeoR/GlpR family transcriptional regulator of sugar metabolism